MIFTEKNKSSLTKKCKEWIKNQIKTLNPAENPNYPLNDIGNSRLFSDVLCQYVRFCNHGNKKNEEVWIVYDGKHWTTNGADSDVSYLCKLFIEALIEYAQEIKDENLKAKYLSFVSKLGSYTAREKLIKDSKCELTIKEDVFDSNVYLLNCENGTFDLQKNEFRKHCSSDMLMNIAPVKYDPTAKCPRFEKFIDEIMCNNNELSNYLQRALGYSISGCSREQCLFIFYGKEGRNGKGVLMHSVTSLLGSDYTKAVSDGTLALRKSKNGSAPSEDLERLNGARIIYVSEINPETRIDDALLKRITGEDMETARALFGHHEEFIFTGKLIISSNNPLDIRDDLVFSTNRINAIPFNHHFSEDERDQDLRDIFSTPGAKSAILNWLIEGFQMWSKNGLSNRPAAVIEATQDLRTGCSVFTQFVKDCLKYEPGAKTKTTDVYHAFVDWCTFKNITKFTYSVFLNMLGNYKSIQIDRKRPSSSEEKTSVILDYSLVDDEHFDEDEACDF